MTSIRETNLRWLLVFVPMPLVLEHLAPDSYTLLFVLSVLANVPLAPIPIPPTEATRCRHMNADLR